MSSGESKSSPDDEKDENMCQVSPEPSSDSSAVVPGPAVQENGGRRVQDVFSDPYLGAVMLVLLLLHLLQNGMRDPCTC